MPPVIDNLFGLSNTSLKWVEPGAFLFQGTKDIRFVKGFYAAQYTVTQELYEEVMKENPAYFKGKHRPVERVSWDDAQEFLQKLNTRVELTDGLQFRLPSETQWEYAARGGQDLPYSGSHKLHEVGWFYNNALDQTMPVGLKTPNAWMLYDMSGNVWEWCEDDWDRSITNHPENGDPLKLPAQAVRAIRGGSWYGNDYNASVVGRVNNLNKYDNCGFRVFRY